MKAAVLFSGGKDSTFALAWALEQGWDVRCLVTLDSQNVDSFMFHTPNIKFAPVQAECLGIPIIVDETEGKKEEELLDMKQLLEQAIEEYDIKAVLTGAVNSVYQKTRVEKICEELGLKTVSPLWEMDQEKLLEELINAGFDIRIIRIAALGLDESFLGKKIDKDMLERLKSLHKKYKVHIAGEGGEFETFVVDGPIFKKELIIEKAGTVMESENVGTYVIHEVKEGHVKNSR